MITFDAGHCKIRAVSLVICETALKVSGDMHMIIDVIHAVAVVAIAAGAVAELQRRVLRIGAAADGALMAVRLLTGLAAVILRPVGIGLSRSVGIFGAMAAITQGIGQDVPDVAAEEQEIVCKGKERYQPVKIQKAALKHEDEALEKIPQGNAKVDPSQILCLDGDNKVHKELQLGQQCGYCQEEGQVQSTGGGIAVQQQRTHIKEQNAAQIIEIKAQHAPLLLKQSAKLPVEIQHQNGQYHAKGTIAQHIGEHIGEQPPDLTV